MSDFIYKIKHIKHYEEKRKFLLFMFILFFFLFLSFYLFKIAYARYEVHSKINANISKALYILDTGEQSFNLEPDGIVPSNKPYVYKFSISNFNETKETDVDIYYDLKIITTTNLPITIKLYRNEVYDNTNSTNLFFIPCSSINFIKFFKNVSAFLLLKNSAEKSPILIPSAQCPLNNVSYLPYNKKHLPFGPYRFSFPDGFLLCPLTHSRTPLPHADCLGKSLHPFLRANESAPCSSSVHLE